MNRTALRITPAYKASNKRHLSSSRVVRSFGFTDAASMPVVRDALVPIVIEQTVSLFLVPRCLDLLIQTLLRRVEVKGAMISTLVFFVNA